MNPSEVEYCNCQMKPTIASDSTTGRYSDALVDPGAADLLVQQHGHEHPDRRGDEQQEAQPDDVVLDGRPEGRVDR